MSARFPLSRPWLGFALLLPAVLALVIYLHWDDRLLFWLKQTQSSEAERQASIWLPGYRALLQGKAIAGLEEDELSGLSYNPASRTLFSVSGKTPALIELSLEGELLRRIPLAGFSDPEGVEILSDGRLAIIDERRRTLSILRLDQLVDGLDAADYPSFDLGFPSAGNKGFEGIAWDARNERLLLGKERGPLGLFSLPFPGEDGAAGVMQPLGRSHLFLRDISSLTHDARTGNSLVLSDESRLLLEVDAEGRPVSFISLSGGFSGLRRGIRQAEGVTMDGEGNIYIVGEPNLFYVLSRDAEKVD